MPAETDPEPLRVGASIRGRYEVVRVLAKGGMGAVYEVLDHDTSRRRALKTLLPEFGADPDLRARFRLEARVAAHVESEHVVEVFDAGIDDATGMPFLVMELLRGASLSEHLARRGALPAAEVVTLVTQAALALDRTHAAGIVHRDLKPENLILTRRDDGSPRVKLVDFGIAKIASGATHPNTTRNLGTPLYMSPEQIRGDGDIDARADLYSLGHITFALLAGRAYFAEEAERSSSVYALLLAVADGAKEPASTRAARYGKPLPAAFDTWFSRATARAASCRFDSASEAVEELALALGVPAARPTTGAGSARPVVARSFERARAAAGLIAALALAALLAYAAVRASTPSAPLASERQPAPPAPSAPASQREPLVVPSPAAGPEAPAVARPAQSVSSGVAPAPRKLPRRKGVALDGGAAPRYDPSDTR